MTPWIEQQRTVKPLLACVLSLVLPFCAAAAERPAADDSPDTRATAAAPATPASEIEQLKKMLLDQQRQIDELRQALLDRNKSSSSQTAEAAEPGGGPREQRRSGQHHRGCTSGPSARALTVFPFGDLHACAASRLGFRIVAFAAQDRGRVFYTGRIYGYDFRLPFDQSGIRDRHQLREHPLWKHASRKPDGNAVEPAELAHRHAHRCPVQELEGAGVLGV